MRKLVIFALLCLGLSACSRNTIPYPIEVSTDEHDVPELRASASPTTVAIADVRTAQGGVLVDCAVRINDTPSGTDGSHLASEVATQLSARPDPNRVIGMQSQSGNDVVLHPMLPPLVNGRTPSWRLPPPRLIAENTYLVVVALRTSERVSPGSYAVWFRRQSEVLSSIMSPESYEPLRFEVVGRE